MKIKGLPSSEGNGRGTRGLSCKGKTSRVILGCGKMFLKCIKQGNKIVNKRSKINRVRNWVEKGNGSSRLMNAL
jgi:hypothetical protein